MTPKIVNKTTIPHDASICIFRDNSWWGLLMCAGMLGFTAVYALIPKGNGINWGMACIPGLTAAALLFLALQRRLSTSSKDNWLVILKNDGCFVNCNFSSGHLVQETDGNVLFIPRESLYSAGQIRETIRLPHRLGVTRHHFAYLDIVFKRAVSEEIADKIVACQDVYRVSQKKGPFPIQLVTPTRLRLSWDAISPKETQALLRLGEWSKILLPQRVIHPDWDDLDEEQKNCFLNELWIMGMQDEALFLGRIHFKVSLQKTREILEQRNHA